MRAVNLFAGFCLTLLINAAAFSDARGQDAPKDSTEKQTVQAKVETASKDPTVSNASRQNQRNEDRYLIGYQDTLEINVQGQPKYSLTTPVAPDGRIRLRGIEPIVAVCKTEQELADEIKQRYQENIFRDPFVSVRVIEQKSNSAAVMGAVGKPGYFYLNRPVRLLELLSYAGGPDLERAGTKLIVARLGSNTGCKSQNEAATGTENSDFALYQFSIKEVLEGEKNLWMRPGDIVSVLGYDVVYVYGNVNEQGSVKLNRPLTLLQAIAEAKGFKPASKKDKIRILRLENGSDEWKELVFDLKEINSGKVKDPFLMPNDIVAVSEDNVKGILNGLRDIVKGGAPSIFYRIP